MAVGLNAAEVRVIVNAEPNKTTRTNANTNANANANATANASALHRQWRTRRGLEKHYFS